MAGEILSQGQVQSSWQVQHFRTAAGAALSQGAIISRQAQHFRRGVGGGGPPHDVRRSYDSTKGALSSVSILQISSGVEGAAGPPP